MALSPERIRTVFSEHGRRINPALGQNFCVEGALLSAAAARVCLPDLPVLEIGPGIGTMTQYLAEAAGKVIAVEIDKNLIPILEDTLSEYLSEVQFKKEDLVLVTDIELYYFQFVTNLDTKYMSRVVSKLELIGVLS